MRSDVASVVFYEKPGCINNSRQKGLLEKAGHTLDVRNLLTENWTAEGLRAFFGELPVAEWFNRSAPRVKEGEIVPEAMDEASALQAMMEDPLLIRRPLMAAGGRKMAGFDQDVVDAWLGLGETRQDRDLENCPRGDTAHACE